MNEARNFGMDLGLSANSLDNGPLDQGMHASSHEPPRSGEGPILGSSPIQPSRDRRSELTTASARRLDEPAAAEEGGAAKSLRELAARDDAKERHQDLDADLSRLTPLVIEHEARVSVSGGPSPLAANGPSAEGDLAAAAAAPQEALASAKGLGRGERLANAILTLFVVSFIAFLAGAALSITVLLGMLKTAWVKDALRSIKDIVTQLSDMI